MGIYFLSERRLYTLTNGSPVRLTDTRLDQYLETVRNIQKAKEWKTTGTGARFAGTADAPSLSENQISAEFCGIADGADALIYALRLEDMGALYAKPYDGSIERHILSRSKTFFGGIDCKNGLLAASVGSNPQQLHLSVIDLTTGREREYTEGDTMEAHPRWSVSKAVIYCSTAGYVRNAADCIVGIGPRAIAELDVAQETFTERLSDPAMDYLRPRDDAQGNLYCIRQPYRQKEEGHPLKNILLFPVRLVRALFGFLNAFSVLFGGESLHGSNSHRGERAKRKSDQELFFEGNRIQAEKNLRENERRGESFAGVFPRDRVLLRIAPDGSETVLAKGVLDYTVCEDGSILFSNGRYVMRLTGGKTEKLAQARLASCLQCAQTIKKREEETI